jgi:hypothetical protein
MDSLGWFSGGLPQMYLEIGGHRVYQVVPFPVHATLAAQAEPRRVYVGTGETWEINVYSEGGRLSRIIRRTSRPDTILADDYSAAKDQRLDGWGDYPPYTRANRQRVLDAMPAQLHYPAFNRLVLDSEGYLWAESRVGKHVFDPDGRWLGKIDIRGKLLDIGRAHVLVQTWDSMRVERVHLFDLRR